MHFERVFLLFLLGLAERPVPVELSRLCRDLSTRCTGQVVQWTGRPPNRKQSAALHLCLQRRELLGGARSPHHKARDTAHLRFKRRDLLCVVRTPHHKAKGHRAPAL